MAREVGSQESARQAGLLLRRAVERPAGAQEVEPAVLAVLGRALAVAPAELLRRVVVTGEVGGLDAPHRARRLRAADLAQHDERCMHVTGGQSRQWHQA